MKILLGNRELKIVSASVLRTMDTGADEWNCIVDWTPGIDLEFDELIKPRSFTESIASIQGQKLITGNKYITAPALSANGQAVQLTGFSKTYRLINSNPKVKKEFKSSSLLDITREFANTFGLYTITNLDAEVNEIFESNPTIGAQDKIFDFLQDLARQRSALMSSDENGNIEYLQADTDQRSVGSITEGVEGVVPVADDLRARFNDTEVFQTYQAFNNTPYSFGKKEPQAIARDNRISIAGFRTITVNSLVEGAGQKAVNFSKNRQLAKSLSMPFQVNSWNAPNGNLWRENTLVDVVSPTLFVPDGFTFLIRAVQYDLDNRGETAVLSLVPPSLYTGEPVNEPWG